MTSVATTYPLDLVRTRLAAQVGSVKRYTSIWDALTKIYRLEGGVRGLYCGLNATMAGVAPYVGLNFAVYDSFKRFLTSRYSPDGVLLPVVPKLLCGAVSGAVSQTGTLFTDLQLIYILQS